MEARVEKGYLFLADISGFTEFMADSELDHAPVILQNLVNFLEAQLPPVLSLVEIEGDAVFAYAPEEGLTRGELLLELVEHMYVGFRDAQRTMAFNATCPCQACVAAPTLDIKFIVHFGEYARQRLAGRPKPVGSSVNLVHRLLKNSVEEQTDWKGYALFTRPALDAMGVELDGAFTATETYAYLGNVEIQSINLDDRYDVMTSDRCVRLEAQDAHLSMSTHLTAPPPIIWDWLIDPVKRTSWMPGSDWAALERPTGRTAPQSRNHCRASGAIEHVIDLRPFDYLTVRQEMGLIKTFMSEDLRPDEGGTHLTLHARLEAPLPNWLSSQLASFLFKRLFKIEECLQLLEQKSSTWDERSEAVVAEV